jgi:RNA polymerase sigma-70 factor (ECF subfamily)
MPMRGDTTEFEDWYAGHYRRLVATMYLVSGDRGRATEAVDEACARAFERWSRVRAMESPAGWTLVVARNALRTTQRSEQRRIAAHRRAGTTHSASPPDMHVEVWDAVRRLPRRQREVIALRYLGDLREREVAEVLAIAPGTVARALHDARQALAEALHETPLPEARTAGEHHD